MVINGTCSRFAVLYVSLARGHRANVITCNSTINRCRQCSQINLFEISPAILIASNSVLLRSAVMISRQLSNRLQVSSQAQCEHGRQKYKDLYENHVKKHRKIII